MLPLWDPTSGTLSFSFTPIFSDPLSVTLKSASKVHVEHVIDNAAFNARSFGWVIVLCQAFIYFVLEPKRVLWNKVDSPQGQTTNDSAEIQPAEVENLFPKCHHVLPQPVCT